MQQQLSITVQGLDSQGIYIDSVRGHEALSEVYEFVVDIISTQAIDLDKIVGTTATIEIGVLEEKAEINGVIVSASALDPTTNREFCYQFTVVPGLALLKLSGQNQVYSTDQKVTVVDIITRELADANKSASKTSGNRAARSIQSQIMASSGDYPKLDFVMQFHESDFNFLNRMCEKFGIFYRFDTAGSKETVYFCDRKEHFAKLSGRNLTSDLSYRSPSQILSQGDFGIWSFHARYEVQTGTVQMREYNDETPSVDLDVSQDANLQSFGVRVDYGENYRVPADGRLLAKKRTELLEAQRLQFQGRSNIPLIRPGLFFKLVDHPDSSFERFYVVTSVEHEIVEPTPLGFNSPDKKSQPYRNRFTCIPLDTQFRPALKTPRPVANGFLLAVVDGENNTGRAELDQYGRYRVRFLDEESGLSKGKASHLIRKVEPYGGGDGYGTHSTLLIGTEVMIGFLHGDPDRPVIVGAFSNAKQSNTVTDANRNVAHRMRTASGIVFQISDGNP